MNELKFQLTTFLLVALLALGAYVAFTRLDRGLSYSQQDMAISEQIEEKLDPDQESPEAVTVNIIEQEEIPTSTQTEGSNSVAETSGEYQELLEKLQDLIDDDINMKEGSRGTRVGTVQNFLNIYFNKEGGVDNQYGPGTRAQVKEFQQKEGLGDDGLAGPNTYRKMIEVLNQL